MFEVKFADRGDVFVFIASGELGELALKWSPYSMDDGWEQSNLQTGFTRLGRSLVEIAFSLRDKASNDHYGTWLKQLYVADEMLLPKS